MNSIITFYSFKGGVGRTMALANIAVLLTRNNKRVLAVDWDLEAPGLDNFFRDYEVQNVPENPEGKGLLDLLVDASSKNKKPNWQKYLSYTEYFDGKYQLDLLMSGRKEDNKAIYAQNILNFDWHAFYLQYNGGKFIEDLRNDWLKTYDVVLIDSRTGITDAGGICTIQLPDILVLVFISNEQSLMGAKEVALIAQQARQTLAYDRSNLLLFPLPSKISEEIGYGEAKEWEDKFIKELEHFYEDWLPTDIKPLHMLRRTTLPYVPYLSFGEKLSVIVEILEVNKLNYAYSAAATLIGNNFSGAKKLISYQSHFETLYSIRSRNLDIRAIYSLSVFPAEQWSTDRLTDFFLPEGERNIAFAVERVKKYASQQTIETCLKPIETSLKLYFEFSKPVFNAIKKACEHAKQLRVASNLKKCLQDNGKKYLQKSFDSLSTASSTKGYDSLSIWNDSDVLTDNTGKKPEIPYKKPEERTLINSLYEFPRILLWNLEEFHKEEALQCIKFHEDFGFPLFWIDKTKLIEKRKMIGHYTLCALKDNFGEDRDTPEIEWNNQDGSKPSKDSDYDENKYRGQLLGYVWNNNIPPGTGLKATSSFLEEFFFFLERPDIMLAADVWAIVQQGDNAIQNLRN